MRACWASGCRHLRITQIARQLLPVTWVAFAGAAITGALLFMANATGYIHNTPFLIKMCLLLALGLNMLYFHVVTYRSVDQWDNGKPAAGGARGRHHLDRAMAGRDRLRPLDRVCLKPLAGCRAGGFGLRHQHRNGVDASRASPGRSIRCTDTSARPALLAP